ncbi:hypothetical protein [Actinacidiphila alni]|uniref:hypothetical protein n=1 Tax=Actinacidiphila alni TaxID=380248 RepID=UPI003456EB48
MDIVGIVVLVLVLAFVTLGVVATVKTVRAAKRGVARASAQARRAVEDAQLKARRFTTMGPAGEVAQLRIDLRTAIDSTFRVIDRNDPSLSEAAGLLDRLNDHARTLDRELAVLEREPDRARLAALLPDLDTRAHRITQSADSLRWAAQDRAQQFAADDLAALRQQIDIESAALRHWEPAPQTPPAEAKQAAPPPAPPKPKLGPIRPGS